MVQTSWPYVGQATTDIEFSRLFRELQDNGVVGVPGDSALNVYADGSGMDVAVQPGSAMVRGYFYRSTAEELLTIDPADASPRIDSAILKLNVGEPLVADRIKLLVKKGSPAASNPSPPALTQEEAGIWEHLISDVLVSPGISSIAATGAVSDRRQWIGQRFRQWSTASRPTGADRKKNVPGFNQTLLEFEYWDGAQWAFVAPDVTWSNLPGRPVTKSLLDGTTLYVSTADPGNVANGSLWAKLP